MTRLRIVTLFISALCLIAPPADAAPMPGSPGHAFPLPVELEADVAFWTRIYTEVATTGGLIHDSRRLELVYEVVRLPKGGQRTRQRYTDKRKRHYKQILLKLASGQRSGLTAEEKRVHALFPAGEEDGEFRKAAGRLRFQLGQADKFRAGLIRSGAYIGHVRATLDEMGLPPDIAALPHVESSFTPHAYSRVGAAGLWQFTRSTGRRFMRVDHVVDERLDPYQSTIAAARLLEQNYRILGSWPLAITAYNHGASGMRRAKRALGTDDIGVVARKYRSRTFGFASRNFYVEFLAAARIAASPERYFGELDVDPPIRFATIEMPYHATPETLARALGVQVKTLKRANPALRPSVWNGSKYVPRGYSLRIPADLLDAPIETSLASVPAAHRKSKQTRDTLHVVRRGETLSAIAARYGVRMSELKRLNNLRSSHRIRAGQKLRLPPDVGSAQLAAVQKTAPVKPMTPPPDGRYTVRPGDTIWKIARQFGMTERELIAHNRLRNRNRIDVGQVLKVDGKANTATSAASGAVAHPQGVVQLTPARSGPVVLDPSVSTGAVALAEPQPAGTALVDGPAAGSGENPGDVDTTSLIADPSDYSVATDGSVEVQTSETLGHFAEWLSVRTSRLRSINGLEYGEYVQVHRRLRLDFQNTTPEDFEKQRIAYHRGLQEAFFDEWEIDGIESHRIRRGDSAWVLSHRRFDVPLWLLRQYNPDLDFESLPAGTRLTVPKLKKREVAPLATAPITS